MPVAKPGSEERCSPSPARIAVGTRIAAAAATPTPATIRRLRRSRRARPWTSPRVSGASVIESTRVVQGATQVAALVVVAHRAVVRAAHRSSSPCRGFSDWGARLRRAASARLAWDFTVPTEQPSSSAVSASLSSS